MNKTDCDLLDEGITPASHTVTGDNGANSFVPLSQCVISNKEPALLAETGHELAVHTIATSRQALLALWRNPYWVPIKSGCSSSERVKPA